MKDWQQLQPLIDRIVPMASELGLAGLAPAERDVLLVWSYSAAVDNGGHASFFYNSYGEDAHETVRALTNVHAQEYSRILAQAIALFPNQHIPRDLIERNAALDALPAEAEHVLDRLDDEFYARGSDDLLKKLLKYWIERS